MGNIRDNPIFNAIIQNSPLNTKIPVGSKQWTPLRPIGEPLDFQQINNRLKKVIVKTTKAAEAPQAGTPLRLLTIVATESPNKQQGRTFSEVSVSFSRDFTDPNFDHINIWFTGYNGSLVPQLMTSGTISPITFLCETTKETVKVVAQPVSNNGISADLASSIATTVALDGVTSAPPQPTIAEFVTSTPTGYEFAFDQLTIAGGTEDVISCYKIYRNTANISGGATNIKTIIHDPVNAGIPIVVQDVVPRGTVMYYWLTAVNTVGLESVKEAAQSTTNVTYQPSTATSQIIDAPDSTPPAITTGALLSAWQVADVVYLPGIFTIDINVNKPGVDFILDVLLWASSTSSKPNGYMFRFDTRSGQNAGQILEVATGVWTDGSTKKAPVNAARLPVGVYHLFGEWNQSGLMNIWINGKWQATLQDTTWTPTGQSYYGCELNVPPVLPYHQNWSTFGSGELLSQGSISASTNTTFTYAHTSTSITWTWTTFDLYNPDGTTIAVPANAGGTAFTGLTPSTTYNFAFIVAINTGICTVTNEGLSNATPQTIAQTFNGDGNVAINYDVEVPTLASGSGGGTGGGGGGGTGGRCFTPGTKLYGTNRRIETIRVGDRVWVEGEEGQKMQRRVGEVIRDYYEGTVYEAGPEMWCTPNHRFKVNGDWKQADEFLTVTKYYKGTIHNLHIDTKEEEERNYVLANGRVAHNFKMLTF